MRTLPRLTVVPLLLYVALLATNAFGVEKAAVFPDAMRGVWDPSESCRANETSDRDSRFEITRTKRHNYEENQILRSAELLTNSPHTWRIVTSSDITPPTAKARPRIYVLEGDFLAIADGQSARFYIRCK